MWTLEHPFCQNCGATGINLNWHSVYSLLHVFDLCFCLWKAWDPSILNLRANLSFAFRCQPCFGLGDFDPLPLQLAPQYLPSFRAYIPAPCTAIRAQQSLSASWVVFILTSDFLEIGCSALEAIGSSNTGSMRLPVSHPSRYLALPK